MRTLGPPEEGLEGPFLEVSTGGPNLIIGVHLVRTRDTSPVKVIAYSIFVAFEKPGAERPKWPREIWSCSEIEIALFDASDGKRLDDWLQRSVHKMYSKHCRTLESAFNEHEPNEALLLASVLLMARLLAALARTPDTERVRCPTSGYSDR